MEKVVGGAAGASSSGEAVIRALDNCYDPCCQDRKIGVVEMGLIESIDIDASRGRIEMVLTTSWCPRLPSVGDGPRGGRVFWTPWTASTWRWSGTRRGRPTG